MKREIQLPFALVHCYFLLVLDDVLMTCFGSICSYCIIRVAGYNEEPTTSSSKLRFKQNNEDVAPVSRADVSQVCVSALLDPDASNVSFYLSKDSSPQQQSFGDLQSDMMP